MAVEHSAFSSRSVAFISLLLFVCSLTEFTVSAYDFGSLSCDFRQIGNNIIAVVKGNIAGTFLEVELSYNENRCRSKGWVKDFVNGDVATLTIPDSEIATARTVCCEVSSHPHPTLETSNNIQECKGSSLVSDPKADMNLDPINAKHQSLKSCQTYTQLQSVPGIGQQS